MIVSFVIYFKSYQILKQHYWFAFAVQMPIPFVGLLHSWPLVYIHMKLKAINYGIWQCISHLATSKYLFLILFSQKLLSFQLFSYYIRVKKYDNKLLFSCSSLQKVGKGGFQHRLKKLFFKGKILFWSLNFTKRLFFIPKL